MDLYYTASAIDIGIPHRSMENKAKKGTLFEYQCNKGDLLQMTGSLNLAWRKARIYMQKPPEFELMNAGQSTLEFKDPKNIHIAGGRPKWNLY
ncbi:MAG: hypothetical protein LBU32_03530 [Clostridiales bacterium]|nr:hypothetical protein [Clostridiales bacterium]